MTPEKRQRWHKAVITGFVLCASAGVVLGAAEIERRGWAFFTFRNTGAGAGNPAGLAEAQGPRYSAGARERMDMHAIQIAAFVIAVVFAYYCGKWAMDWRPHLYRRPPREAAAPRPRRVLRPLRRTQDAWEGEDFYRTAPVPVVTDAQPSRRWWRRNYADEVMEEAATFVGELNDTRGDEEAFAGRPGTTTINSIEDVLAWGKRQEQEMDAWAAEQKERMESWTAELTAWRDEMPQLALNGSGRDG